MNLSSIGSWRQTSTSSDSDDGPLPHPLNRQESFFSTSLVDGLVNDMKSMTLIKNSESPPLPPKRIVNYDNPVVTPPRECKIAFEQNEELLKSYIEQLKSATRYTMNSVLSKVSSEGRNVLHYVALASDFSEYKAIIAKRCNHKQFHTLVLEQSIEDLLTPMHVICQKVNIEMLHCLMASKNERMIESLTASGTFTDKQGRTLLHCFGDGLIAGYKAAQESVCQEKLLSASSQQAGFLDKNIVALRNSNEAFKIRSLELLALLEKLYGSKVLGELFEKQDSQGETIMSLAKRACRNDILEKICEIQVRSLKSE